MIRKIINSIAAMAIGYCAGLAFIALAIARHGLQDLWFFAIMIGLTVVGIWILFFLPLYLLTGPQSAIWKLPFTIALGSTSGALFMGAFWWSLAKVPYCMITAIIIMTVAFLWGRRAKTNTRGMTAGPSTRVANAFLAVSLTILVSTNVLNSAFLDKTTQVTKLMTWTYEAPSEQWPDARHVLLRFKDTPRAFIGIYSTDLGTYLDSLPTNTVAVTFDVTRDYGKVRGYNEVQIGTLRSWNSANSYGGTEGSGSSFPF